MKILRLRVHLYVPEEGTCPSGEAVVRLPEVPLVGDLVYCPELAPKLGPGASLFTFRVTSRTWGPNGRPSLHVARVKDITY